MACASVLPSVSQLTRPGAQLLFKAFSGASFQDHDHRSQSSGKDPRGFLYGRACDNPGQGQGLPHKPGVRFLDEDTLAHSGPGLGRPPRRALRWRPTGKHVYGLPPPPKHDHSARAPRGPTQAPLRPSPSGASVVGGCWAPRRGPSPTKPRPEPPDARAQRGPVFPKDGAKEAATSQSRAATQLLRRSPGTLPQGALLGTAHHPGPIPQHLFLKPKGPPYPTRVGVFRPAGSPPGPGISGTGPSPATS
nr:DNA-3-methyladenine glycosylase isoform X3 [Symphalangus syndactylus]